ncbi:ribonuclease III [Dethiosulfovibrio salsuginis]|uniref:Ribonuclease 3 n=1 Tax=Dethiosulfovibrio salsuginis TaxID=561720 RepID=A0A1X7I929_9BACT|nr:ribonuclease III [Dethiosulfovibrio salsuginis]SMG11094.1 ribonuclease-3 [Dethiosulfovibrio salsuginis]
MYGQRWEEALKVFQVKLGYRFRDAELLKEALTHSSYAHESGLFSWNERLEYLGDAVLELAVSTKVFNDRPDLKEGDLTRIRSRLVCGDALLPWAKWIGIDDLLRVNSGVRKEGRRGRLSSVYSDAVEAVFGAVYVDGGFDSALSVIDGYLNFHLKGCLPGTTSNTVAIDPKSEIQKVLQERGMALPEYRKVSRIGPSHNPTFVVELWVSGKLLSKSKGKSIKEAEFKAAEIGLKALQPVAEP